MLNRSNKMITEGFELVINRIFNASPARMFDAWTNPAILMKWWGPKGFTLPVCKIDLSVGGEYLLCMRSPQGVDYWSKGIYQEIEIPHKIVATDSFVDSEGNIISAHSVGLPSHWPSTLILILTFESMEDGRTNFTLQHRGLPKEMLAYSHDGWTESLDKLEDLHPPQFTFSSKEDHRS